MTTRVRLLDLCFLTKFKYFRKVRSNIYIYIYITTCFSTHIHNINYNIGIYLIRVTLFNQIHDCLGEEHTDLW